MRFIKITLAMVLGLGVMALVSPLAHASALNTGTAATFDQPVEIPGMVLPAGTYVFTSEGPAVQIWDKDQRTVVATLLTNSVYRNESNGSHEFTFAAPHVNGAPNALDAWFSDGDSAGREFIYPKTGADKH